MRLNRRSYLNTLSASRASATLLFLFLGTLALSVGLNLFLTITGITSLRISAGAGQQTQDALAATGLTLSLLLYGLLTPLLEELVFRALLYSGIYQFILSRTISQTARSSAHAPQQGDAYDPHAVIAVMESSFSWSPFLIAAGCSSLLFSIYHMNLAQGIYAFLMGMTFCLSYELTGQFLSPWILHAACNIISLLLSRSHNGTNAFTQLLTWPWTAAFLAVAIAALVCLRQCFRQKEL